MVDRIKSLCVAHKTNFSNLEKELGFANGSLAKSKEDKISADRVRKIAEYFNVSMEYILIGKETDVSLTSFESDLLKAFRRIDSTTQDNICLLLGIKKPISETAIVSVS